MRTLLTFIAVIIISFTSKGQINFFGSFSPKIDTTDLTLLNLAKQKKLDEALTYLTSKIKTEQANGANYFNRAVVKYYKPGEDKSNGVDTSIYNDCKRALSLGYDTPELHYLIFALFQYQGLASIALYDEEGNRTDISYDETKPQIDLAIEMSPRKNAKYLFARAVFLYNRLQYEQTRNELNQNGTDELIDFPDRTTFEFDCLNVIETSKDNYKKGASHYFLSQISYILDKDTIKAIQHLSDAIASDTGEVVYYSERAKLKYEIKNYRGAIADYNIYLTKQKRPEDFKLRANCYSLIGNEKTAILDYSTAISLFEKQLIDVKKKNEYFRIEHIKFNLGQTYYFRGLSYLSLDNKLKACADWNKAIDFGYKDAQEAISENCQ